MKLKWNGLNKFILVGESKIIIKVKEIASNIVVS